MTRIPLDPIGYSVNPSTGTIHTRYATHGNGTRTRTEKGVLTLLHGKEGSICSVCYPHPRYSTPAQPAKPQERRIPSTSAKTASAIRKNGDGT